MSRKIKDGYIKYVVRKNRNTDRWELTIQRKMFGWLHTSSTIIQSPSWDSVRMYAIDHWSTLGKNGHV